LLQPRPPPNPWAKAPADVRTVAMMQTRTSRRRVLWSSPGKDMFVRLLSGRAGPKRPRVAPASRLCPVDRDYFVSTVRNAGLELGDGQIGRTPQPGPPNELPRFPWLGWVVVGEGP